MQARWYLKAAEGGYVRAMYNVALCYSVGEGLAQSHRLARKWMKRAADRGHSKAQFEHGLGLFSVCHC
jgi:TPR repeat protein